MEIHNVINEFPLQTEIAVAKIVEGEPFFYGARKTTAGIVGVDNKHSVFEVGSLTKVFTSTLLAQSVHRKEMNLDDPIHEDLPVKLNGNPTITYKQLATHTAGIPSITKDIFWRSLFKSKENPYNGFTNEKLLAYIENDLKVKYSGRIIYSNMSYAILGYLLARRANHSYGELLSKSVLQPLQMNSSFTSHADVTDDFVHGLSNKGVPGVKWDIGAFAGAGGLLSSVSDLSKFVLANFDDNNEMLSLQRQLVVEEKFQCIALGWMILDKAEKGERIYFHNGGTGGYSSAMLLDMQKKNSVIVLSNISGLHKLKGQKVDKLTFKIMSKLFHADKEESSP